MVYSVSKLLLDVLNRGGSIAVFFMVIFVVLCVLGIAFVGTYYLNKAVDQSDC